MKYHMELEETNPKIYILLEEVYNNEYLLHFRIF